MKKYESFNKEKDLLYEINSKLDKILYPQYIPVPKLSSSFNLFAILDIMNRNLDRVMSVRTMNLDEAIIRENRQLKYKNEQLEIKLKDLENEYNTLRKKNEADLIKRRGNYKDDITIEKIKTLRERGLSIQNIADKLHTSRQTIYNRIKEKD